MVMRVIRATFGQLRCGVEVTIISFRTLDSKLPSATHSIVATDSPNDLKATKMPMTRGQAREIEEREVDVDEEGAQPHQQQQQQQEQEEEVEVEEVEAPAVELKEMLMQVFPDSVALPPSVRISRQFDVRVRWVRKLGLSIDDGETICYRELEDDAAMIQAGMDELYRMQEVVCRLA
ncbi:hypothetical protein BBJ28_00018991 [Nothophytophthora sp. Chile5]|nr:hypothetical protein BBJ28_00018991 [Nothophytophthora sp. Chile5]